MGHKTTATTFLQLAAMGEVQKAYDLYVAPDFIHHNQYFKGDRQSLLDAMKEASTTHPNRSIAFKQVLEEGDTVVTYSQVVKKDMEIAVVHIFRFAGGKIVELWDVGQAIAPDCPNENGLF